MIAAISFCVTPWFLALLIWYFSELSVMPCDIKDTVFDGMTVSSDMTDDADFLMKLRNHTYQLAVTHFQPEDPAFHSKKIGHESLFISLTPGNPLAFYPEVHLQDRSPSQIALTKALFS